MNNSESITPGLWCSRFLAIAIRPNIQKLLGLPLDTAQSDLMGELRLLRNWLMHPNVGGNAEKEYFEGAQTLLQLLRSQPGKAEVNVRDAFLLMKRLNTLSITVNPLKQEEIVQFVKVTPETLKKIQSHLVVSHAWNRRDRAGEV